MSPFDLDERARRAMHHPAWTYWGVATASEEPPKLVRLAGLI